MSENRAGEQARGYLRINRFNKYSLLGLNLAIWSTFLLGYIGDLEAAGLFSISIAIHAAMLKMTVTQVKRESQESGYTKKESSFFEILNKFSNDLSKGTLEDRVAFRKSHEVLSARLDATATLIALLASTLIFWGFLAIKIIF